MHCRMMLPDFGAKQHNEISQASPFPRDVNFKTIKHFLNQRQVMCEDEMTRFVSMYR